MEILDTDFHERMVQISFHKGTEFREEQASFYKDSGLGYIKNLSGKYLLILKNGLALCRYVLPTRWQIEEACARLAPHLNFQDPNCVYAAYAEEHYGETLNALIREVFVDIAEMGTPAREPLPPVEEHLQQLKNFVLDRDDAHSEYVPPLLF